MIPKYEPVWLDISDLDANGLRLLTRALFAARLFHDVIPDTPRLVSDSDLTASIARTGALSPLGRGPMGFFETTYFSFNNLGVEVESLNGRPARINIAEFDQRHAQGPGTAAAVLDHVRRYGNAETLHFARPKLDATPDNIAPQRSPAGTASVATAALLAVGASLYTAGEFLLVVGLSWFGMTVFVAGLVGRIAMHCSSSTA